MLKSVKHFVKVVLQHIVLMHVVPCAGRQILASQSCLITKVFSEDSHTRGRSWYYAENERQISGVLKTM
jgi:hypothetical protein